MRLFVANSMYNLVLKKDELLLIPEFKATLNDERNKTDEDEKGIRKTKAFKEWTFIWLYYDSESIFFKYKEQHRLKESLRAAKMTEADLEDPVFKAAAKKYVEIQNNTPSFKLLKSANHAVEQLQLYFEQVDLTKIDPVTNKPVYSPEELMVNIMNVKEILESLRKLNESVKSEKNLETFTIYNKVPISEIEMFAQQIVNNQAALRASKHDEKTSCIFLAIYAIILVLLFICAPI